MQTECPPGMLLRWLVSALGLVLVTPFRATQAAATTLKTCRASLPLATSQERRLPSPYERDATLSPHAGDRHIYNADGNWFFSNGARAKSSAWALRPPGPPTFLQGVRPAKCTNASESIPQTEQWRARVPAETRWNLQQLCERM